MSERIFQEMTKNKDRTVSKNTALFFFYKILN